MNYKQTIDYLFNKLPFYQKSGPSAYKEDLTNSLLLDEYFHYPHQAFKSIHIAGTNGKGSVAHMVASVLQSAGYKTGLYTSPHLKDFRERIKINGKKIKKNYVVKFIKNNQQIISKIDPSFFEISVALAFTYFKKHKIDIAVIEVGLGGRLDSTNVIKPIVSIITNISFDHTNLLGNTLEQIAFEKAGIIKEIVPVIIGETNEITSNIFIDQANAKNSPIYFSDQLYFIEKKNTINNRWQIFHIKGKNEYIINNLKLDLLGNYQEKNIITTLNTIETLKTSNISITDKAIYKGISCVVKNTGFKGRFQILKKNPAIICDTGHNFEGIRQVIEQIKTLEFNNLHIIIGFVNDKEIDKILEFLPKNAIYYFTQAKIPRALNYKKLYNKARGYNLKGDEFNRVKTALKKAKKSASKNDLILITGSTFIVSEVI